MKGHKNTEIIRQEIALLLLFTNNPDPIDHL